ncbi:MAG: hypothetical protein Fur0032_09940 [Terrimicrobiaceae bacterium]
MKRALLIFLLPALPLVAGPDLRAQLELAAEYPHSRIEILRRLIATRPDDVDDLRALLVELWLQVGDFEMAGEELAVWRDAPEDIRTIVSAKQLAADPEKRDEAIRLLKEYLGRHPDSENVLRTLVGALQATAKTDDLTEVLLASPVVARSPDLLILRARQLLAAARYEEALKDAALASTSFPDDKSVQAALPAFERLKEVLPRLLTLQSALEADPSDLPSLVMDARLSAFAGLDERARVSALRATGAWPDSMAALLTGVQAGVIRRDEAVAAGVLPDALPKDLSVLLPLDQKVASNHPGARMERAEALLGLGQPGLALRDTLVVLETSPSQAAALRVAFLAECSMGRPDSAAARLAAYEAAKPGKSELAIARQRLAEAQFAAGRLQEALELINLSLDARPASAAFRLRAAIFERLGRSAEAAEDIRLSERTSEKAP